MHKAVFYYNLTDMGQYKSHEQTQKSDKMLLHDNESNISSVIGADKTLS